MTDEVTTAELAKKLLTLNRVYPSDLHTHFVSNVVAQAQPEAFILSFFEIWPPLIIGETEEERLQQASALESIEAKCVARFVVTPNVMREMVDIMSENLRKHDEAIKKAKTTEE